MPAAPEHRSGPPARGREGERGGLQIRVLGPLEVIRDGQPVALPKSKKTRGLLSYLAITAREHRRDRLCALLWDVADDPRGALRWSLSKVRPVVNGPEQTRLVADRSSVQLVVEGGSVDLLAVRRALAGDLDEVPVDKLTELASRFRGELLEGLELGDFHEYTAWCAAERERARTLHARLLSALVDRLRASPERAATYAREHVRVDPYDEHARAALVDALGRAGQRAEAEAHYHGGRRLLAEIGLESTGPLESAWRALTRTSAPRRSGPSMNERLEGTGGASTGGARSPAETVRPSPVISKQEPGGSARTPDRDRSPLVGRAKERALMAELLERPEDLRVLLLTGESGVGKSRLLEELSSTARRRGCMVLEGRAYEAETGRPYGPWVDALRGLPAGIIGGDARAALSPLLPELGEVDEGSQSRDRLFGAIVDVVAAHAKRDAPVLILFDDVHWCDDATAELLHYVARMNRHRAVAVVLAARDGELVDCEPMMRVVRSLRRERLSRELALRPFDEAETRELVEGIGGSGDPQEIFSLSGGNALLASELARAAGTLGGSVPSSLADLVGDRLARLSDEAADVLRWGAVLGPSFDVSRLAELCSMGLSQLDHALGSLERHGLLTGESAGGGYAFTHELVRHVIYSKMSEPRRCLMHLGIARLLGSSTDPDGRIAVEVAHHAGLGGDAAMAARACVRAGERCLRVFANAEAYAHAKRGLHYAAALPDPEQLELRLELTRVSVAARRPTDRDGAAREIEARAEEALDAGCLEHARLGFTIVSYLRWEDGDYGDARRSMLRAELASRGSDPQERVIGMAEAARCLALLEREFGDAEALLLEARAVAQRTGMTLFSVPDGMGLLRLHQGQLTEAAALFEKARSFARRDGNRLSEFSALEHLLSVELLRGDHRAVRRLAGELVEIGDKLREGSEAPFAHCLLALAHYAVDPESGERLDATLEILRDVDAKQRLAMVLLHAAALELARGEFEVAERRSSEALEYGRSLERPSDVGLALCQLARCAQVRGEHDARRDHLAELRQLRGYAEHVRRAIEETFG